MMAYCIYIAGLACTSSDQYVFCSIISVYSYILNIHLIFYIFIIINKSIKKLITKINEENSMNSDTTYVHIKIN